MNDLTDLNIDNVVIYVGDAVRYDQSIDKLSQIGSVKKTIASSLHTPASFGSMLTGLYPPNTGMISFSHECPNEIESIFSLRDIKVSMSNKGDFNRQIADLFQSSTVKSIDQLEEPFIHIVRDPGGHAPYDGYTEMFDFANETAESYLSRLAGKTEMLKQEYNRAIDSSISRFKDLKKHIEDRFGIGNTLYIYTSDHGELLGEHGHLGHNYIAVPELVYVPTTFIHPDINPRKDSEIMRHVDLVPTILDILGIDKKINNSDGESILDGNPENGYNYFETYFYNRPLINHFNLQVSSVWDGNGGVAKIQADRIDSVMIYAALLATSHKGSHIRATRSYIQALKSIWPEVQTFGTPPIEPAKIEEYIDHIHSGRSYTKSTLDQDTKEKLEDLGYM